MMSKMSHDFACGAFQVEKRDEIALLRFHDRFLLRSTDLSIRDQILEYMDFLSGEAGVKVLIVVGSPEKSGRREYLDFYRHVTRAESGVDAIHRMHNVFNQLILKIVGLDKIVVHCNSGEVIFSFLNLSLACDYRIVAENTVFQNPCLQLGLVPKGGGAFFLPRIVGLGRARNLLLSDEPITARDALNLGLVDQVASTAALEEAAIATALQYAAKPKTSLSALKRLLAYSVNELEGYLDFENRVLMEVILSSRMWRDNV